MQWKMKGVKLEDSVDEKEEKEDKKKKKGKKWKINLWIRKRKIKFIKRNEIWNTKKWKFKWCC